MGSLREEMAEELKGNPKDYRQILSTPKLVGIAAEGPRPCVLLTVLVPNRLKKRIKGMSKKEAQKFFNNGPGRCFLGQDTLVVLMEPPPGHPCSADGARRRPELHATAD